MYQLGKTLCSADCDRLLRSIRSLYIRVRQIRTKRRRDEICNRGEFSNQITKGLIDEKTVVLLSRLMQSIRHTTVCCV